MNYFFPSYLRKKGENIATKEDIAEITQLAESVKADNKKNIETHRQGLDIEIEKLKLEQNQLMANFELYTAKRHECYAELYKLIEISNGSIRNLRGLGRELTFDNVNSEDLESFMNNKQFTSNDIELILKNWNENKSHAIKIIRIGLERIDYNEANEKFVDANNYLYFMSLYLSEDIENIARELLDSLHKLWWNYEPGIDYERINTAMGANTSEELLSQIDTMKQNLKVKMREELMPHQ